MNSEGLVEGLFQDRSCVNVEDELCSNLYNLTTSCFPVSKITATTYGILFCIHAVLKSARP